MTNNNNQELTLLADMNSPAGTVNGGTVTFTLLDGTSTIGSPVVSAAVASGRSNASYTLPANTPPGTYTVQADYSGTNTLPASTDRAHTLTITAGNPALGPLRFVP